MPLVSVIMPVYNSEKYVEEAIHSVFQQTYTRIELIVINDGSTDKSAEIIQQSLLNTPPGMETFIYHQKNQGPSVARNLGIGKSKGRYIAFLDADDLYEKNKIKHQIEVFKNNPNIDVVYNDVKIINSEGAYINFMKAIGKFSTKENLLANMIFRQLIPAPASMMLRRHCFNIVMYNPEIIHSEDYDFTLRVAQNFNLEYVCGHEYICRRHASNLSNNIEAQQNSEKKIIQNLGIKYIERILEGTTYEHVARELLFAKIMIKIDELDYAEEILMNLNKKVKQPLLSFYLGNIAFIKKELEIALIFFIETVELDNKRAEAFNNLGCTYRLLKNEQAAIENFTKAIYIKADYLDAQKNLLESDALYFTKRELREELLTYLSPFLKV
ncbi:glycosyl transferase [Sporosarcina sp. P2]|uniref:glycosyltransferase n=1 Tax=Sporosarcina sp. P2 TaxID=2048251 RepID=UPI000C165D15|nr:glycosyltransferase [Sporosarcina sp. P2]PID02602.1 glycosyl transferase [Sporosarcina sp. P2]